jgi:hypothetical protein
MFRSSRFAVTGDGLASLAGRSYQEKTGWMVSITHVL